MTFRTCTNCGATLDSALTNCPVCGFDGSDARSARVIPSNAAVEASDGLGGILAILELKGTRAAFVGRCVGGLFAMDHNGVLLWRADWGYISTCEVSDGRVIVNGIALDADSGEAIRGDAQ